MTITEAVVSGVIQGVTEFLPVSSSGHLVFVHRIFGFTEPNILFDICLHIATLMAVILYFRRDIFTLIREGDIAWIFYMCIGTVPAVLAALLFDRQISAFFVSPVKVAFMLVLTALILFLGQFALWKRVSSGTGPTYRTSLLVGMAQAFALLPGISRSGITISAGLLGGMKAEETFRFSFLLSIPIVIGAMIYKLRGLRGLMAAGDITNYVAGMLVAFVTGVVSLHFLWRVVKIRRLFIFGVYCLFVGIIGIAFWK